VGGGEGGCLGGGEINSITSHNNKNKGGKKEKRYRISSFGRPRPGLRSSLQEKGRVHGEEKRGNGDLNLVRNETAWKGQEPSLHGI